MTCRRSLTTKQKLEVMLRFARCPMCGEKFTRLDEIDWDHVGQLYFTGDNSLDNFRPLHRGCHKVKTAKDAFERAKCRRVTSAHEEFRRRILAKERGEEIERKSKWPSRPFPKRRKQIAK